MKRWHLTLGLATTAVIAAAFAPRLHAMWTEPTPVPPPITPVIEPIQTKVEIKPQRAEQAQGPLVVRAGLDRSAVLKGNTAERFLTIHVSSPADAGAVTSVPVNVAVVMDTSGSMAARGKIDYAKRGAKSVVRSLGSGDDFSLVTFNDAASVAVPVSSAADTRGIERQIDRIYEGGGTNLYAGMDKGMAQVSRAMESGEIGRLIILSDGQANVGITSDTKLAQLAGRAAEKGIVVSAMGLGLDYNEDLLARIADEGGGTYDYIDAPSELEAVFAAEAQRTQRVVARNTAMEIELPAGVEPLELIGWNSERTATGWRIFMGDIPAGATRKIVARVKVSGTQAVGDKDVAHVRAIYTDLTQNPGVPAVSSDHAVATVTVDPNAVASSLNLENAAAANRAWGNTWFERSTRAYERGDSAEAISLATKGARMLREAATTTGDTLLKQDAQHIETQTEVFRNAAPSAADGRRAIKRNKEFLRDAYR